MEYPNLNPPPENDANLAELLRQQAPVLPDDGFSARVLAALPPRSERHWLFSPRFAVAVGAGALAGITFAWRQGSTWRDSVDGLSRLDRELAAASRILSDPNLALALALTVISLLVVYLLSQRLPRFG